ncbi:MAG: dihydropteroate synthase [Candidatus Dormibacteria bacterium]
MPQSTKPAFIDFGPSAKPLVIRDREFHWGERTYIMSILNVTPDSFSGDGVVGDLDSAVRLAVTAQEDGADILDMGAESTRPGAPGVTAEEEIARLLPVLERVRREVTLPISVDTSKAIVARAALDAGADMINDVWALRDDGMSALLGERKVPVVLMHNRAEARYFDLVGEVTVELAQALVQVEGAGLPREMTLIDPGFGFGKTARHNLELLRRLREFRKLGRPVLIGTSRKSTIGKVLDLPVEERLEGTAATVALAVVGGADMVRVHDTREMVRVARMADAVVRGARDEMPD